MALTEGPRPGRLLVANEAVWDANLSARAYLDVMNADVVVVIREGTYEVVKDRWRSVPYRISWSELHRLMDELSSVG